jgi:hypothetical protein
MRGFAAAGVQAIPSPPELAAMATGQPTSEICLTWGIKPVVQRLAGSKRAKRLSGTETVAPLRGLRPARALRCFTENVPKPRSSTRSPRASAAEMHFEDECDNCLDVTVLQAGVRLRQFLNEFRFRHRDFALQRWHTR